MGNGFPALDSSWPVHISPGSRRRAALVAMTDDSQVSEFLKLYTAHEVRLRAFALSLVPSWADAEEVVQQASLVMWQKFGSFQLGTRFFSWAARIVHLTAKDHRKRQRRGVVYFGEGFAEMVAEETAQAADELAERERVLSECIKKLKPKHRNLLDLRYREDHSGERIAGVVGTSVDAVYQSLARIRKALFDCVNRGLRQGDGLT